MYKVILPIRYLFKRRISYFSVVATALCVFVVFVVITVLSGLTAEFKRKVYLSAGDCVVSSKSLVGFGYYEEFVAILGETDFIEAVSPVIKNYALVDATVGLDETSTNRTVEMIGVNAAAHSRATGFGQWLYYHSSEAGDAFTQSYDSNLPGCVPGIGLLFGRDSEGNYETTESLPRVKFEVSCFPLTAKGALAKAGAGEISTKTFYCSDYVQSGLRADGDRIYLPFEDAQMLCGMGTGLKRVNAIHIKFRPGVKLEAGCERVKTLWDEFVEGKSQAQQASLLENVKAQSWKTYSRMFVAAVETEQTMMIVIFGMIGIITVFIVFVVFYMIVCHKSKDIGILKSVGVSGPNILLLFLGFSFLVGAVGSAVGAVAGWQFLVHINQIEDWLFRHFEFQLWDRRLYSIGDIPNAIDLKILAGIITSAIVACMLGALIPSAKAGKLKPVETLQVSQL